METIAEYFGVAGVLAIIVAYSLLSAGKINADDWSYSLINLVASLLIVWSLTLEWNLSAFLMELSWAMISFYGLIRTIKRKLPDPMHSATGSL